MLCSFQAMRQMNKQMKLPQIQKIMQEFEKQSEMMDMKQEMMEDAIDDAMDDVDDEEERYCHQLVNKLNHLDKKNIVLH